MKKMKGEIKSQLPILPRLKLKRLSHLSAEQVRIQRGWNVDFLVKN